jgi:hypothetical protein
VSDLVHCQKVVERMVCDGRTLAEVEEYIERCALDQMEKAGLCGCWPGHTRTRPHNCALPERRLRSSAACAKQLPRASRRPLYLLLPGPAPQMTFQNLWMDAYRARENDRPASGA